MSKDVFNRGLEIRKNVLGAEFVENSFRSADEFNLPMQNLVTEYCWGAVWGREELPHKTRSMLNLEEMVMAAKAGIEPETMLDIINAGSGRNSATQDKFPKSILPRTFDFGFATGLSYKDVRLCIDEAEAMGVPHGCWRSGAPDACCYPSQVWSLIGFHFNHTRCRGVGRSHCEGADGSIGQHARAVLVS